jgi:long-subunit fatty acid transport protein
VLLATSAEAQLVTLELSYSNPGARSMGFGGAFVALADDATAAFANPSGLVQLTRPEVSAEGRRWSYSIPYTTGGRLEGVPSGIGLDTSVGLRTAESSADIAGLSFLSFVYPKGDWSIALYRHELASFAFSGQTNGLFTDAPAPEGADPGFAGVVRDQDTRGSLDNDIVSYGLAVAYRPIETLSLGVGVSFSDGSLRAGNAEYLPDDDSMASYFAAGSYLPEREEKRTNLTFAGTDWTLNVGVLWSPAPRWRLGGFYRQGPGFDLEVETLPGPAGPFIEAVRLSSPVSLPDVYGLGIAHRAVGGRLTIAFEWDRVEYSTIFDSVDPRLQGEPTVSLEDGSELHFGAEYAFLDATPVIALRLGAWLDPTHRVRAEGDEPFSRALFPGADDEIHYAVGFGLAFERLQIDLGVDLSSSRKTVSVSGIFGF